MFSQPLMHVWMVFWQLICCHAIYEVFNCVARCHTRSFLAAAFLLYLGLDWLGLLDFETIRPIDTAPVEPCFDHS